MLLRRLKPSSFDSDVPRRGNLHPSHEEMAHQPLQLPSPEPVRISEGTQKQDADDVVAHSNVNAFEDLGEEAWETTEQVIAWRFRGQREKFERLSASNPDLIAHLAAKVESGELDIDRARRTLHATLEGVKALPSPSIRTTAAVSSRLANLFWRLKTDRWWPELQVGYAVIGAGRLMRTSLSLPAIAGT